MFPINLYPYQNVQDYNLDWLIKNSKNVTELITNFITLNSIKYADPIEWDITTQYPGNTVVFDNVNHIAYLSLKPVPAGVTLNNTDYWTVILDLRSFYDAIGDLNDLETVDKTTLVNAINETYRIAFALQRNAYITPDDFAGDTDGEKLQAALDSLATAGGTIVLNRIYTLDRDITISHDTAGNSNSILSVVGLGEQCGIDFATYSIKGADNLSRTWGGLRFINCYFVGTEKAFITDFLIRLYFIGSTFELFDYVFYGTEPDSSQTIFIEGCHVRKIKTAFHYTAYNAWDTHISGSLFENLTCVCDHGGTKGLFVVNNLIEGVYDDNYTNKKFVFRGEYHNVVIDSNYFEDNETVVDMSAASDQVTDKMTFSNNTAWEHQSDVDLFILPSSVIYGNVILSNNSISMGGFANAYGIRSSSANYQGVRIMSTITTACPVYDPNNVLSDLFTNDYYAGFMANVNVTYSTDIVSRIRKEGKIRRASILFELNENVASGSVYMNLQDVHDAPYEPTIFFIKEFTGNAVTGQYWSEIDDAGQIYTRYGLTSGKTYSIDAVWITK